MVQSIDEYDAVDSAYVIEDSAGSVLGAQATILDSGVAHVDVTSTVSANIGVALGGLEDSLEAGYSSDISFTVSDDASAIASELSEGDELNNADDVNVVGRTIDVADAAAVQNITAYDDIDSAYVIEDSAGSVLGAQATILDLSLIHI